MTEQIERRGRLALWMMGFVASTSCASQALIMERNSSGAVERDVDFTPVPGTDGHYISLPAYPLSNCVDTLVYDRLAERMKQALTLTQNAKNEERNRLLELAHQNFEAQRKALTDGDAVTEEKLKGVTAARDYADALFANDASNRFNKLLEAASAHKLSPQILRGLLNRQPSSAKEAFPGLGAIVDNFVSLADDFGATPCMSSPRYRNFLGYRKGVDASGVSWLDGDKGDQLPTWSRIEDLASDATHDSQDWPAPMLSFLHFSDVQIREPNAKLGSSELSHQLKQLVSSFEQDYVQEQYALYVYDAIVNTANGEIDLGRRAPSKDAPTERDNRPPPTGMIHTGDSADTGLQSEFDTFLTYTNHLHVPWYQAIGNHDVLAFGNMRLTVGDETHPRLDSDICHGSAWSPVACTCTNLSALVRNQEIPIPNNRGYVSTDLPSMVSPLFPVVLQRICLVHAVAGDWFVMDPDKRTHNEPSTSVTSFILSHCRGWHPKPGEVAPFDASSCEVQDAAPKQEYAVIPDDDSDTSLCATLHEPATTEAADSSTKRTLLHGLDLSPGFWKKPEKGGGYYCYQMKSLPGMQSRRAWAVVLNTNSTVGAYGELTDDQLEWLKAVLPGRSCTRAPNAARGKIGCGDLVLIFAHHPIYSIYDQDQRLQLTRLVTESPNVIGYFAGHIHRAGLRVVRPLSDEGRAKWEILAPSVIDYPQAARQITVKAAGDLGYIEVLTFSPYGSGASVDKIEAAGLGAMRDKCHDSPSDCTDGRVRLEPREVIFPRAFFRMPPDRPHPD